MKDETIKNVVRARYAEMAEQKQPGCCSGCGCEVTSPYLSEAIGYLREDLEYIPKEANMGLGCGNPTAIADLKGGETVLDLGSRAGIDVFLAANKVGPTGRVIGIDMTREMIEKANTNAWNNGYENVEFQLGEIENLPVENESVDVVISNCVINLSTDKAKVFQEIYRVLKPEGRLTVSDIVSEGALPDSIRTDPDAWVGCIAGALEQQEYLKNIREAGFRDSQVVSNGKFHEENPGNGEMFKLLSVTVKAYK